MTQTTAAASDRSMPARGWQIFMGIVTTLAGIVLIVSPLASVTLLVLSAGSGWSSWASWRSSRPCGSASP
ncbi:hypothetical protein [Saccharopolyspora phatthalungensis]|uniref:Uncharacterized membrane protein HdeD (DUF308 family) n=1 Tax=Saccharopolyspora phatthalungensis TaxID=664693 RepID=A0A840Q7L2_9PSEU|nr:hypothetical protein [Saccharopolyspora phatthalungensis]MBB5154629.1 uncharacterized membrane protein HdeD (DUF308 family) [Saccharopolyspora phatthalungensis]